MRLSLFCVLVYRWRRCWNRFSQIREMIDGSETDKFNGVPTILDKSWCNMRKSLRSLDSPIRMREKKAIFDHVRSSAVGRKVSENYSKVDSWRRYSRHACKKQIRDTSRIARELSQVLCRHFRHIESTAQLRGEDCSIDPQGVSAMVNSSHIGILALFPADQST